MNIKIKSLCCSIILAFLCTAPAAASDNTADIAVTIFSSTYYGSYSGDTETGSPSGEGSFICTDGYSDFSLTGIWENGLLNGDTVIQYGDGSYIEATFKKGLISGKVKQYYANGSYRTYSCSDGRPNGLITHYDIDGNITGFDYFYQMKPVNDLKASCIEAEYRSLLKPGSELNPYKISGTVSGTFDDASSTYVLLKDSENHFYVLTYKNKTTNKYNQAIVPNLMVGDKIIAYGFLQKQYSLSSIENIYPSMPVTAQLPSTEASGSDSYDLDSSLDISDFLSENITLPFITLFVADLEGAQPFNRSEPSFEYEDIVRNPYLYSDLKCTLTGMITRARVNYDNGTVLINLQEQGTANEYLVRYSFSDGDPLPSIGDTISLKGTCRGNDKRLQEEDILSNKDTNSEIYIICPRVNTSSITIL